MVAEGGTDLFVMHHLNPVLPFRVFLSLLWADTVQE